MKTLPARFLLLALLTWSMGPTTSNEGGGLAKALAEATKALDAGNLDGARVALERALERDPNSSAAWELQERWAERRGDADERVYALHRLLSLARAQKRDRATLEAIKTRLKPLDPVAGQLESLRVNYVEKLTKLAEGYEKGKRPHSAIRAYKQALALDPDRADIQATIERLASSPDPSLAEDARPRDLLEGVSDEWIREHDEKHSTWENRAALEKPNYVTQTDAGYEVLVRTAEAMEQMNAFYRVFFRYGAEGDKRNPSRIYVNIYKTREEYTQDPNDWSGGHFTGDAVETYIPAGGFEVMTGVLFHEAAHQFVSLATNAAGWLNEGLASYFEGTRILANGTVIMNLPATQYLFSLTERMDRGWMASASDGLDPQDVTRDPPKAPTFRIVLEDRYEWAPPWYAPTWGVVFFLYNFQDPTDGRFVYRKSFWDFVDASGGKSGESAIQTFEETVLGHPQPVTEGQYTTIALPKTVDELAEVWKRYLFDLRDQQSGKAKDKLPYLDWARNAKKRGAPDEAAEHYEKALLAAPSDVAVLTDFAEFLSERKQDDRAAKLFNQALAVIENTEPLDQEVLDHVERRLRKIDPAYQRLDDVRTALILDARGLIDRYLEGGLNLQAMDVAFRLGTELQEPSLFVGYEKAVRAEGRSIARWKLAYNEEDMDGWNAAGMGDVFKPAGETLDSKFGEYSSGVNDYQILTLDELTSGDYSLEAEVEAQYHHVAFAGLVFGRKAAQDFHALVLFPPSPDGNGFANLVTFYGSSSNDTWRRNPVQHPKGQVTDPKKTRSEGARIFYKLRVDVTGRFVDTWVNGEFQATQEFPSLDVLRGSFGLITGRGEARFRNVRFLSRHPRDPSAAIERKLVLEARHSGGEAVNGSWVGLEPPFPSAKLWYQGERKSWDEAKGYPQLLVMWSTEQNEQVKIDAYLRSLHEKHQDIGLRVLNLLAFWNEGVAESYLKDHPFPDAVALDSPTKAERNIGITFERYDIARFQLPRFILIDIDGKVAWEGDPGFAKGVVWSGEESLLDTPLRELSAKRKLPELVAWRKNWPAAREALARGDFAGAAPVLSASATFDPETSEEVAEASAVLSAIEGALGGADALAADLAAKGREPALEVLLEWAEALGKPLKKSKAVSAALKSPNLAAWKRTPGMLKPVLPKVGKDDAAVSSVLDKVAALPGAFTAELAERGRECAGDAGAMKGLLDEIAVMPARWLASEHFGW